MQAIVKRVEGLTFLGRAESGHWVAMDGKPEHGGAGGACTPKELMLLALGGCSAFDVEGVLRKRRQDVRSLTVELDGDVSEEHPKVFTEVRITFRIEGSATTADVERAVRLSQEKYCAVTAMLRHAFPVRWKALVNGEEVASGMEGAAGSGERVGG